MSKPIEKKNSQINKSNIDCIIFDLGKVIIEVNHEETYRAFAKICKQPQVAIKEIFEFEDFQLFELGKISEQEFFLRVENLLFLERDEMDNIVKAWDAMIVGVSLESVHLLNELKKNFSVLALSNTNATHIKTINRYLEDHYHIKDIRELFDKVYYSYELGLSKPNKKIFEYVFTENRLIPERTLFIDDNFENICAARELKLQTIHLLEQTKLAEELNKLGIF